MSITVKPVAPDFMAEISGLDLAQPLIADGRLLLMDLIEHATQRRFVHSHTWKQGDLVIWDNRCTMHRARPFDTTKARDLRRVTTRDVASTVEQPA